MGNPKAFLTIPRKEAGYRPIHDRILDFSEVEQTLNSNDRRQQASRCMDCGVPFCHWACPLGNKAPEWNDALYKGDWELAYRLLNSTNDFPEFTGRICPALCEKACILNLMDHEPTTNREDECAIVEHAFSEDYVHVEIPERNGKTVAVIGAGPAGLVAANQLNHKGYKVTVFEARENAGGLLRYGIPNFKLNKSIIDRRLRLLEEEGIEFKYNQQIDVTKLPEGFDAYVVSTGTPTARDLKIPGRELKGVYFALELLSQQNRVLAGMEFSKDELVNCKGKDVLVIGGGDTGSDCIGTAHRQGCKSVTQIEIMPKPVEGPEDPKNPWPNWPRTLKTTSSHEEGCTRRWNINSLEFLGKNGKLTGVKVQPIDWKPNPEGGRPLMVEAGEPEIIKAEAVFLAMGFLKPQQPEFAENVFVAGDAANGASLVVRAMASGRKIAEGLAEALKCRVYDRQIICLLAEKLGMESQNMDSVVKYLDSYNENETFTFSPYAYPAAGVAEDVTDMRMFEEQTKIIQALSKQAPGVFLGRCANFVLGGQPHSYSFFLYAYDEYREKEGKEYYKGQTLNELKLRDIQRNEYYQRFTGIKRDDPKHYDMVVNVSKTGVDGAVKMILDYIEQKEK